MNSSSEMQDYDATEQRYRIVLRAEYNPNEK